MSIALPGVQVVEAGLKDKAAVANLLQLYLYEMTQFQARDTDAEGVFAYPGFEGYWEDGERPPGSVAAGNRPLGPQSWGERAAGRPQASDKADGGVQAGQALLARAGRMPAGFCLVREGSVLDPKAPIRTVAELFVPRSFRRLGIGRALALAGFRRFPGRWEVREAEANEPAQAFWRKVIGAYTAGAFVELALADRRWRGPVQTFDNSLMLG